MKLKTIQRICLLWAVFNLLIVATGCSGQFIDEASSILRLLIPAVNAALALLAAFGVGVSPDVQLLVSKWGSEAIATLTNVVKPLLEQLKTAEDSAKGGLFDKIQAAVQTIADDLTNLLPSIHVTNPATQAKITAIFQLVLAQLVALVNLIPAVKPNSSLTTRRKLQLSHAVLLHDEFRHEFNQLTNEFGPEYLI